MNARFMLPGTGRFASADPIVPNPMNPQSYNRYSYTLNNHVNYTDPSGHWECESEMDCSSYKPQPQDVHPGLPVSGSGVAQEFATPFPVSSEIVTTPYDPSGHVGTDYGVIEGTEVSASTIGLVVITDWCSLEDCPGYLGNMAAAANGGYGNVIIVEYGYDSLSDTARDTYGLEAGDSLYVLYAHLSLISTRRGNIVQSEAIIGETGSTGNSSGDHLHAEFRTGTSGLLWNKALCTRKCSGGDGAWGTWWGLTTNDPELAWE